MKSALLNLDALMRKAERALVLLSGFMVYISVFLLVINILMRNLFDRPIVGVYEIIVNMFAAIVSFSLAYVQQERGNISVELISERLPHNTRKLLEFIGLAVGLVSIGVIAWQGGTGAVSSFMSHEYEANSLLKLPLWPAKSAIAIGMLLLVIRLVLDLLLFGFGARKAGSDEADKPV